MTKEDEPKTEKKDDLAELPAADASVKDAAVPTDEKNPFAPREADARVEDEPEVAARIEAAQALWDDSEKPKDALPAKTEEELDEEAPLVTADPPGPARWVPLAIAVGLPALFFFALPPLTKSGLWDPFELNVADLARRLALNLHGAAALALENADNSLPHLNDLGRPQLPFTSVALGFKYFGLHEWAGRAPLALWGVFGVLATYGFVARMFDRRAGVYAAVALTTMPLYFVQSRSILGDICTMSALAMAFGGLVVAVFDRDDDGPTPIGARIPWIAMALLGLAAGWGSRGGLIGIGVPATGVGAAWALSWAGGRRRADGVGDAVGALSLVAGVASIVAALLVLGAETPPKDLNLWVGAMIKTQAKYPTFDFYIGTLGHALAPWSAFIPFALGRLFLPPVGRVGHQFQRESWGRMALLVGAAVAFGAHGLLAARTDLLAFCAPALGAAACGVAIRDFERGAHASIAVGVGTGVLLGVFHHDFHEIPEKAYQAFAVVGATFPESFKATALSLWWAALGGFALVAFLTWVERDSKREPFAPANYMRVLRALREAWDGLLALAFFATVAGASLAGLFVWVGVRTHAKWLPVMSLQIRDGVLNAWWVIAFVPLAVILGLYFACDLWVWAFDRSKPFSKGSLTRGFEPFEELYRRMRAPIADEPGARGERLAGLIPAFFMVLVIPGGLLGYLLTHGTKPITAVALSVPFGVAVFLALGIAGDLVRHRAAALALGGALVGAVLCVAYYPALANQLSPKEVFESYRKVHKSGEPLALLGVGGRTAAYYAGGQPLTFPDAPSAYAWLKGGSDGRRYLAMKSEELPKLNQIYRERMPEPRANLPIIDARSSQILLVGSSLLPDEKNENPLDKIILSALPQPHRKLDVNMEDKLQVLGIDIIDLAGKPVESVAPGRKYHMRTYYRVLGAVGTEWEAFIHIDGFRRRHNGDHKPMGGKYPMGLWLVGDLLVDEYEFGLEPNFTPGAYTIYFGLFVGDTRLKVKSGPSDGDNRVNGGQLKVQ